MRLGILIVVFTDISDIIAYRHGLHFCREVNRLTRLVSLPHNYVCYVFISPINKVRRLIRISLISSSLYIHHALLFEEKNTFYKHLTYHLYSRNVAIHQFVVQRRWDPSGFVMAGCAICILEMLLMSL